MHKSTASRLLAALDRRELVAQDTARGKFRLGVGIVRLAGAASQKLDVVQETRPVSRTLAQEVGETVNLAILSGRDALYLDQVAGPAALSPHNWAGRRIPLHAPGRQGPAGLPVRGRTHRMPGAAAEVSRRLGWVAR